MSIGLYAQSAKPIIFETYQGFHNSRTFHNDTTYIINFWATWCKPCVEELPHFEAFHKKYADKPYKVILLSLDFKNQIESHLMPFLFKNKISAEIVVLTDTKYNTWMEKVDPSWSGSIPATWIIKAQNNFFIERDFDTFDSLETYLINTIN